MKVFKSYLLWIISCLLSVSGMARQVDIIHGPYLQNLKETEVTIVWLSNKPTVGWVELIPNDNTHFYLCERPKFFDTTNGIKNVSDLHSVKINGLKPGTSYRYRVFAREVLSFDGTDVVYGQTASTDVFSKEPLQFTTNSSQKKELSFLIINDIHGHVSDIKCLLEAANYKEKELFFFNGDMLSEVSNRDTIFSGFMDEAVKLFASEKPMYYARGNHETRVFFARHFQDLFSVKEENLYFMFRQGPICFIVLDTGEDKPDSDIEYCDITDYDTYRSEQARWLSEVVKSDMFKTADYHIVIAHMPPLTDRTKRWHGQEEILRKFIPILNEVDIDLMLCGHLHKHIYQKPSSLIKFPIWVNSFDTVIEGTLHKGRLSIKMLDKKGNILLNHNY